jgi:hypothetical protein
MPQVVTCPLVSTAQSDYLRVFEGGLSKGAKIEAHCYREVTEDQDSALYVPVSGWTWKIPWVFLP